jgi:hypothetical protein
MSARQALAICCAAVLSLAAVPAVQAADVDIGVSIGISQPGVYGRIDIGRFPQPQVIVAQPVIVTPPRMVVGRPVQPVYMWVPPGHRKQWRKHCGGYGACGVPVVFVQDDWYEHHVHPRGHGKGGKDGKGRGKGRGYDD